MVALPQDGGRGRRVGEPRRRAEEGGVGGPHLQRGGSSLGGPGRVHQDRILGSRSTADEDGSGALDREEFGNSYLNLFGEDLEELSSDNSMGQGPQVALFDKHKEALEQA